MSKTLLVRDKVSIPELKGAPRQWTWISPGASADSSCCLLILVVIIFLEFGQTSLVRLGVWALGG